MRLKLRSASRSPRKVSIDDFGRALRKGSSLRDFLLSLPSILASKELLEFSRLVRKARSEGKPFIVGMGAHPIKVGITPYMVDLMERGYITAVATNGASMVHDLEIALFGRTSEDVEKGIKDGSFGMIKEVADVMCGAVMGKLREGYGLGEAMGRVIEELKAPFKDFSLFYRAFKSGVKVTVHIALGTDVFNMYPDFDGALFGRGSHRDFLAFVDEVKALDGGVFLNMGSAVIIPEVFLKAVSMARNMGYSLEFMNTCVFDFTRQYRAYENVTKRPVVKGKGFYIVGHHELLFPLFYAILLEEV